MSDDEQVLRAKIACPLISEAEIEDHYAERGSMTDLKEAIAKWLYEEQLPRAKSQLPCSPFHTWETLPDIVKDVWHKKADALLALLREHGLVQLDKDQELPDNPFREELRIQRTSWGECQDDMAQDGFRRVHELGEL